MKLTYIVDKNNNYTTIREVLKSHFEISNKLLLNLKTNNKILLNNEITYVSSKIENGDIINVLVDFEETCSNVVPKKMELEITYEDECYIVVNKPSGIVTQPSASYFDCSLANGIRYYFDKIQLKKKIRPINRLDKDTSGLIVFAKNEYIHNCLSKQMMKNEFIKEYIGILDGVISGSHGTISAPIARKENSIIERCINENGGKSITHYEIIDKKDNLSIVKFKLETGKTHQIRVHSAHLGHPIIGDTLYGCSSNLINRQALHSYLVSFLHPITKNRVTYISEPSEDMNSIINC